MPNPSATSDDGDGVNVKNVDEDEAQNNMDPLHRRPLTQADYYNVLKYEPKSLQTLSHRQVEKAIQDMTAEPEGADGSE